MRLFNFFKRKPKKQNHLSSQPQPQQRLKIKTEIVTNAIIQQPNKAEIDLDVITVETRLKTAIASKHGLYPHEILLLDYAHSFYINDDSFQNFWWYRYGVRDVKKVLNSLMVRGFLQEGNLQTTLQKQTIADIKNVLKTNSLKTTGKKADLIQRALDNIREELLCSYFPKRTYQLTEHGLAALNEESYVSYIHRHVIEDLDIWSLNQLIHTEPYMPFRDKIWEYLNKRSMKHFSEHSYGLYINCRLSMAQFLIEENKYANALTILAETAIYELNGIDNIYDHNLDYLEIYAEDFFTYEDSMTIIFPSIITNITECQDKLGYSDDELKSFLSIHMKKNKIPVTFFSVEDCVQIIIMEKYENKVGLKTLYSNAKKVFKQKYPNIYLR